MTDYQPGRIYSGVIDGERRTLMYGDPHDYERPWLGSDNTWAGYKVTDVRGPLVVLDANYYADCNWHDIAVHLRNGGYGDLANQIEAQTRPPLQVGWHECHLPDDALPRVLWWDGENFLDVPHDGVRMRDGWRSVAYLGKGTRA